MTPLLIFVAVLLIHHLSEVLLVIVNTPKLLSPQSFLISSPYLIAMSFGLLEHLATLHYLPGQKKIILSLLTPPGFLLIVLGEALRKSAWLCARRAFTHIIATERRDGHELITHGIYAHVRHPGYLGWMVWACGTQLVLGNVICAVAFVAVAWRFFSIRIPYEEEMLVRLFQSDYIDYKRRTPTWIYAIP